MNLLSGVSLEERLPYLSHTLLLDLSYLKLTDWQLAVISSDNDSLRLELTAKGELVVKPLLPAIKIGWQAGNSLCNCTVGQNRMELALRLAHRQAIGCLTARCMLPLYRGCLGKGGKAG